MFRSFGVAVLGWIAFAIVTYFAVVLSTILVWDLTGVHDQDGGGAMALGLVIAPTIAFFGGIVGAVLVSRWYARRNTSATPSTEGDIKRDRKLFAILGGAIGGAIVGHFVSQFGFWLVSPIQFDSYWKAWAVSWVPTILLLLGAFSGGALVRLLVQRWKP